MKKKAKAKTEKLRVTATLHSFELEPEIAGGDSIAALFQNVADADKNEIRAEFAKMKIGKKAAKLNLSVGSVVSFACELKKQIKGEINVSAGDGFSYKKTETIKLNNPSDITVLQKETGMTFDEYYSAIAGNNKIYVKRYAI